MNFQINLFSRLAISMPMWICLSLFPICQSYYYCSFGELIDKQLTNYKVFNKRKPVVSFLCLSHVKNVYYIFHISQTDNIGFSGQSIKENVNSLHQWSLKIRRCRYKHDIHDRKSALNTQKERGENTYHWKTKLPQPPVSSLIDHQHPWQMDLQPHIMDDAASSCPNQTIAYLDKHT